MKPPWEASWAEVARILGGEIENLPSGFARAASAVLRVEVDGNAVRLETARSDNSLTTVISAQAPGATGLQLSVRSGYVYPIGRALGIQDVDCGDPVFDDKFIIKTNDVEFARAWLSEEVRRRITEVEDDFEFSLAPHAVVTARSYTDDARVLIAGVRAVAALAGRGREIMREWQHLARAIGGGGVSAAPDWLPDGRIFFQADVLGTAVRVASYFGPEARGGKTMLFTRVSAPRIADEHRSFVLYDRAEQLDRPAYVRKLPPIDLGDGCGDGSFAARFAFHGASDQRIAPAEREQLSIARPWSVFGLPQEVALFLRGMVLAPVRVYAAVRAVAVLASTQPSTSHGPYR